MQVTFLKAKKKQKDQKTSRFFFFFHARDCCVPAVGDFITSDLRWTLQLQKYVRYGDSVDDRTQGRIVGAKTAGFLAAVSVALQTVHGFN